MDNLQKREVARRIVCNLQCRTATNIFLSTLNEVDRIDIVLSCRAEIERLSQMKKKRYFVDKTVGIPISKLEIGMRHRQINTIIKKQKLNIIYIQN